MVKIPNARRIGEGLCVPLRLMQTMHRAKKVEGPSWLGHASNAKLHAFAAFRVQRVFQQVELRADYVQSFPRMNVTSAYCRSVLGSASV